MHMAATADLMQPFLGDETLAALTCKDMSGKTPRHYAAISPITGPRSILELRKILAVMNLDLIWIPENAKE
jgi:hypothetical protein